MRSNSETVMAPPVSAAGKVQKATDVSRLDGTKVTQSKRQAERTRVSGIGDGCVTVHMCNFQLTAAHPRSTASTFSRVQLGFGSWQRESAHRSLGFTMVKSKSLLWVEPSSGLEEPEAMPAIKGSWKFPAVAPGAMRTKPRPRLMGGGLAAVAAPAAGCRSPSWETRM